MLNFCVYSSAFLLFLATVAGGAAYFFWWYRHQKQEERENFKTAIVERLGKLGSADFDMPVFARECQVSGTTATQVAKELYAKLCAKAVEDGLISSDERGKLNRLAQALSLDESTVQSIEQEHKGRRYKAAVEKTLADGTITEAEDRLLRQLRKNFGLSPARALRLVGEPVKDGYLALFHTIVSDGQITDAEFKELERYREALALSAEQAQELVRPAATKLYASVFAQAAADGVITAAEHEQLRRFRSVLGLSEQEATELVRDQAITIYRGLFYHLRQDGEITNEEEARLARLQAILCLTPADVAPYLSEVAEIKRRAALRRGELPSVSTRCLLEAGEICHWIGECTYAWQTATTTKNICGDLIVTSNRIIFSSPTKSFEFSPTKIIDIQAYSNGLTISTSGSKGAGNYLTADAENLEAVLYGIVRKHKYLLSESFSSSRTRHIPDTVKREVWYRDGGKCVRCGSVQYLEYDHIIPHCKGGANTVNNVQVLCRGCNAIKRDRI